MEAYLDNSATTRCSKAAADMVYKLLTEDFGNPSSLHMKGVIAENYINDAKKKIAKTLKVQETLKVPTGIRVKMDENWVLKCYPRSGLGFKYRLQLNNTVGIVDEDYYYSDNEGHIFLKVTNDTNEAKILKIKAGEGFAQGIFVEYGITYDDDVDDVRNGGFGSTSN